MSVLPRVASLLPSATEIVGKLGLQRFLVGVSHECDLAPEKADLEALFDRKMCRRVTTSEINPHYMSQKEVHERVLGSLRKGDSLYGINEEEFKKASPTIVLTQSLCDVCAPSANQVAECLPAHLHFRIINLEPRSLDDVADSFKTISSAIVKSVELGESLATQFYSDLKQITSCVRKAEIPPPTCVMLEWTEPLFDGGHWVPDMMRIAGASYTLRTSGEKSRQLTPTALAAADPDCIIVACCGYDLRRNIQDGQKLWNHSWWRQLRAVRQGRVFAADGNRYFARPGPSLVGGAAILARCVYDGHDQVGNALHATSLIPPEGEAWARLPPPVITQIASSGPQKDENNILCPGDAKVSDIEDIFWQDHQKAVAEGQNKYIDRKTGYYVFTELSHRRRGKCCGQACRHCPFGHESVRETDRPALIKQPAWLCRNKSGASVGEDVDVLIWTGDVACWLALRRLATERRVVLLSAFDVQSRNLLNTELSVQTLTEQAFAFVYQRGRLNSTLTSALPMIEGLVGVPLHPGRSYSEQILLGLQEIQRNLVIKRLCFSDVAVSSQRRWREVEFEALSISSSDGRSAVGLHFPLWGIPHPTLLSDLIADRVRAQVINVTKSTAASETAGFLPGADFNSRLFEAAQSLGWSPIGERGEFSTHIQLIL